MGFEEEGEWSLIPDSAPVKFDSGEHADIPSECYLKFALPPNAVEYSGKSEAPEAVLHNIKITDETDPTNTNVALTFGKVVALAGDFYVYDEKGTSILGNIAGAIGLSENLVYDKPLCFANSFTERKRRVREGVKNLMNDKGDLMPDHWMRTTDSILYEKIVPGLKKYLGNEMAMVERFIDESPKDADGNPEDKGVHNISITWRDYAGSSSHRPVLDLLVLIIR